MDYRNDESFKELIFDRNEKNTFESIENAENIVAYKFPEEYINFMLNSNGANGEIGEAYINVWSIDEVLDYYEISSEAGLNNLVFFASNEGNAGFAFNKEDNKIYSLPIDSLLKEKYLKCCSDDLISFFEYLKNITFEDIELD